MRKPRKWSEEDLPGVVAKSRNLSMVLELLGLKPYTLTYNNVKNRIVSAGIDTSHFVPPLGKNSMKSWMTDEQIFVQHSRWRVANWRIKERLRRAGWKEECECGQGTEWNGKPLVLVLDHINGDNRDNRLENLRFLCPNCNSQTPTFAGRNRKNKRLQREGRL